MSRPRPRITLGLLACLFFFWGLWAQSTSDLDPKEIIDRVDRILRGESSHGIVEMTVVTKRWQRALKLEIWSEGTEKALIKILSPKKE